MIDSKLILKLVSELDKCVPPQDHLNKDGLIGFFYALAITPIIIPPEDWMAELFFGERPNLNGKQVKDLKKAVISVVKSSNNALIRKELNFPYDFSILDDEMLDNIWHWSSGFLKGLYLRLPFWKSGIVANETQQMSDVVARSVVLFYTLVEGDLAVLENIEQLKIQIKKTGKEPTDELIMASLLQTLPEAYECIRIFAAQMSDRLKKNTIS